VHLHIAAHKSPESLSRSRVRSCPLSLFSQLAAGPRALPCGASFFDALAACCASLPCNALRMLLRCSLCRAGGLRRSSYREGAQGTRRPFPQCKVRADAILDHPARYFGIIAHAFPSGCMQGRADRSQLRCKVVTCAARGLCCAARPDLSVRQ
jgi:hypothetical protein